MKELILPILLAVISISLIVLSIYKLSQPLIIKDEATSRVIIVDDYTVGDTIHINSIAH